MNRCKTCKWWIAFCSNPKVGGKQETDDDGCAYQLDEGGYILTGPDFGCVHHEEKE